jgi:chromatin segregation and condensation protein Rec8/ScpA/Scc1 (kleisin family)
MSEAMIHTQNSQLVPASFAEKSMASLMQLHGELMDEKERRVDLFRRLMEREQSFAELKFYVKVLEERLEKVATPAASTVVPPRPPDISVKAAPQAPRPQTVTPPPVTIAQEQRPRTQVAVHGWRTW